MRHAVIWLVLAACFESDVEVGDPIESHVVHLEVPLVPAPRLDLLVVVDRSPAMAPYLDNLAANLPRMIEAIDSHGALPSVHLGVVAANNTQLETTAAIAGDFVVDLRLTDGNRLRNYEGALVDVFPALVAPRADATGSVHPLEAMRHTLSTHPTFRRRDAHLMVAVLAGTDDNSPDDPLVYAELLQELANQRVAVAAALPHGSCGAAPRLERFLAAFGHHALVRPICETDLSDLLTFANIKTTLAGPPCLPALADADPSTTGLQAACAAELAFGASSTSDVLPACTDGSAPCWEVVRDAQNCPYEDGHAFLVRRALLDELPFETMLRADCLVEPQ